MTDITILYVDDKIDPHITQYIDSYIKINNVNILTNEYTFNIESDNYKTILENTQIQEADIIIIDSRLFENAQTSSSKISGEELKIILTKFFPYKSIIVISQNGNNDNLGIIGKYNSSIEISINEFYDAKLKEKIKQAVNEILIIKNINAQLIDNANIEAVVKEKIENALEGICQYDELSKQDIDNCIKIFNEIKEMCEHDRL